MRENRMGGASRNERKRRQEAANARLAAGPTPPASSANRTTLIAVGIVVLVVVVAAVTVLLTRGSGERVAARYPATASGAVVTAGSGPVVIDVYEDYLCPSCERFEQRYGTELGTALNEQQITVRYHHIAILDDRTTPAGYSTRAANAALCAVPAGIFPAYRERLFDEQPAEGGAGLTDEQLVTLGAELGATGDFAGCVTGAVNARAVATATEAAATDPALQTDGSFGTPTVAINGVKIDLNDTGWLRNAIAAG